MSRRLLLPLAAGAIAVGLLAGCTGPATSQSPSSSPSSSPTASESATPPAAAASIVVALDGISFTDDSGTTTAGFDDGAALLALLEQGTGELPAGEPLADPYGGETSLSRYTWDGISVIADANEESPSSVSVTAAAVAGIPIATEDGLAVGSTRSDLLAADAWALVDTEDPATATNLGLGGVEVPGTSSLTRPGAVGQEFTLFLLEGDVVTQIQMPSNDFSDI